MEPEPVYVQPRPYAPAPVDDAFSKQIFSELTPEDVGTLAGLVCHALIGVMLLSSGDEYK
jgi:hypothetical protein